MKIQPKAEAFLNKYNFPVWVGFFAILLLRGDGLFPLPHSIDPRLFRAIVLAQTFLLAGAFALLVIRLFSRRAAEPLPHGGKIAAALAAGSLPFIFFFHSLQSRRFAEFGYADRPLLFLALAAAALAWGFTLWRRSKFLALLGGALLLKLYPLFAYPVTSLRSDMLPILSAANEALLRGENVYKFYLLDNGVSTQNVRFPGLIAAYLPAVALRLDLRWVLLICEAAFFALAYRRWGHTSWFFPGLALLAFFPYWHVRHELYEAPFWLLALAVFISLERIRPLAHPVLFALLISFHQWGVLWTPLLMIYLARKTSPLYAFRCALLGGLGAIAIVKFFCKGDFAAFFYQTFGYYSEVLRGFVREGAGFHPFCLYFTPELAPFLGADGLRMLSYGLQAALITTALFALNALSRLAAFLAVALFLMMLTNTVAWTYQYLLVGALIWIGFMAREDGAAAAAI